MIPERLWVARNDDLISLVVHALVFGPAGTLFVGTDRGVFEASIDGGEWTRLGSGPSTPQVISLAYDKGGQLFAGTAGGGVFEYSFTTVVPSATKPPARVSRRV